MQVNLQAFKRTLCANNHTDIDSLCHVACCSPGSKTQAATSGSAKQRERHTHIHFSHDDNNSLNDDDDDDYENENECVFNLFADDQVRKWSQKVVEVELEAVVVFVFVFVIVAVHLSSGWHASS